MNPPQVYMCSPSWTLLPPPSPFHPSGSSQCTSPKHPVSCIEPGLATCFIHDILHVLIIFNFLFWFYLILNKTDKIILIFLLKDCWLTHNIILVSGVQHINSIFYRLLLHLKLLQCNGNITLCNTIYLCVYFICRTFCPLIPYLSYPFPLPSPH